MKTKTPKYSLGEPPKPTETRHTLNESEPLPVASQKVDGRTLRRTGRSAQFNVMLSPDFREQISQAAETDRLTYPQLLAVMLRAYSELPPETKNAYINDLMATWGK
ncbi:hypothetical protein [Methylovulum psychrotolerans]|uniref:Uncharacterized protein n=1 Tax=Methylovulum psychrotolerans TaxID=1704499 RepID=A0A2S5CGA7_9GAMM|nr:hypothetical protein [Methylovulum psychrotolerans]POZ49797.1 hypothetical protein AADEFJLK_04412 [Methylovulum psychrotolerans]